MPKTAAEIEIKREKDRKRKEAQRIRDRLPGGKYEKTYRATKEEHGELADRLRELRRDQVLDT